MDGNDERTAPGVVGQKVKPKSCDECTDKLIGCGIYPSETCRQGVGWYFCRGKYGTVKGSDE